MKNLLIMEKSDYSIEAIKLFRNIANVYFYDDLKSENKKKIFSKINIIVVRLKYRIDCSMMARIPNLELIVSPTTGLDHIDLEEAAKRKIKIISLKGHTSFLKNITSTAEEAFALILSLIRNIPWAFEDVKNGNWQRDKWKGHQLLGKNLGLIGCGRLGKIMASYGRAFGMKIIGVDPYVPKEEFRRYGIKKVTFEELMRLADVISVHVNLNDETIGLIGKKELKMMKKSAYLINTSRGDVLDEIALHVALESGWIAGAAIDVMHNEIGGNHLKSNPLIEYSRQNKNLIIVPHIGGATYEAMHITEEYVANLVLKHYKYGK